MRNLILAITVLTIFSIPSYVKAEVVNYRCNNDDSEFQVDTNGSKVTIKKLWLFW